MADARFLPDSSVYTSGLKSPQLSRWLRSGLGMMLRFLSVLKRQNKTLIISANWALRTLPMAFMMELSLDYFVLR